MKKVNVKIINDGFAYGPIYKISSSVVVKKNVENVEEEQNKFFDIIKKAKESLKNDVEATDDTSKELKKVYLELLDDEKLVSSIKDEIENKKVNLEYAIKDSTEVLSHQFEQIDDEYIKNRASDIRAIGKLLLKTISNEKEVVFNVPYILVSKDLTVDEFLLCDKTKILGIITNMANETSHVSIVAKSNSIPFVYDENIDIDNIENETKVIIDSDNKQIILEPEEKEIEVINKKLELQNKKREELLKSIDTLKNVNTKMKIFSNISTIDDVSLVKENGGDGIGLFRTEFLYMNRDTLPTEDEQFDIYKKILESMGNKEVIIRTIDIGSDKKVHCINLQKEENPQLGNRGIRLAFANIDIFETQLRALLRAAVYGNESIMFPMIASKFEVDDVKSLIEKIKIDLEKNNISYKIPKIGIMIETPAAALISDILSKEVDFFSIGTNDLTQYTLAIDRNAKGLEKYFNKEHEAIFKLIKMVVDNAHKNNVTVGICGDLASHENVIKRLVNIGVDEVSVTPNKIPDIKKLIIDLEQNSEKASSINKDSFVNIQSPVTGEFVEMKDINDAVFSKGILGECFGIVPSENTIYSPVKGKIVDIAKTKHAITINSGDKNYLIHIGIDTVELKKICFDVKISVGDEVEEGTELVNVDFETIKSEGYDTTVICALLK